MSSQDFENKIKKFRNKSYLKSFLSPHAAKTSTSNVLKDINLYTPIEETPPHKIKCEPNVNVGDLVTWEDGVSPLNILRLSGEDKREVGLVIGARWVQAEESARFSKKQGEWISRFVCFPQATVMWNDGQISNIPMEILKIKIE
jgi:hypothetical protein